MAYQVIGYSEKRKNNGYVDYSDYGVNETFETLEQAQQLYESINLKNIFVTEWNCRQKPWLSMQNTYYSKELLEVENDEIVDCINIESFGYWHYKADELAEETWQGAGIYKVNFNNPTFIDSEEKLKTIIRPLIATNPTVEFCGSRD